MLFGGSGQLGHDIRNVFTGKEAFSIESLSSSDFNFNSSDNVEASLADKWPFDILINAMANSDIDRCDQDKDLAYRINHRAVEEMGDFCSKHNIPIYHFSTNDIFDGKNQSPYTETDQVNPISIYGASKLAGEQGLVEICEKHFIFRVSTYYGALAGAKNFILDTVGKAKNSAQTYAVSDQQICATHSLDIAKALLYFIENEVIEYGIYNCAAEGACSWFDLTSETFAIMGIDKTVEKKSYIEVPDNLERPVYSVLDMKKISKFYQMPTWQESLENYLRLLGLTKQIRN